MRTNHKKSKDIKKTSCSKSAILEKFILKHIKKAVMLLFILVGVSTSSFSQYQEYCSNIPASAAALRSIPVSNRSTTQDALVKLYFHVYQDNFGNGGVDLNRLDDMTQNINGYYAGTGISFFYNQCEVRFEQNTVLFNSVDSCDFFFQNWEHEDGIDVHVKDDSGIFRARASEIPGGELILSGTWGASTIASSSTIFGHEMGHCLGLFHTHHGTCDENPFGVADPCTGIVADGGNPTDGDFVDDTPPDPHLGFNVNASCEWNGISGCSVTGSFNPLTDNFMSYTTPPCLSNFTDGQVIRMYELMWPAITGSSLVFGEIVLDVTHPTCLGYGSISALFDCPTEPFTYLWSNGETTQTVSNLTPGIYSVTITDVQGSDFEASTEIEPEIVIPSSDPSWINAIANYSLNPNELQHRNIYVENELIIDVDYTFSNVTFGFSQGGKLSIESGYNVEIKDLDGSKSILKACDEGWAGITVEGNAALTMKNSKILDASSVGIAAESESTIDISGIDIIGNNGRMGIALRETVNLTQFKGIRIVNYTYGVYAYNNTGYYNFGFANISNTVYGFYLLNSPSTIEESTINSTHTSVYMDNCPGSIVVATDIYGDKYGMHVFNSNNLRVDRTSIGSSSSSGEIGIELNNCSYSNIFDFEYIYATDYGIKVFQSSGVIIQGINHLDVSGFVNTAGGGIQLINGVDCEVKGINIDANHCSFGIESIEGFANRILENDVSVFSTVSTRTAAIRTLGSEYETINENTINGLANVTGIIAQNSPGNTYICNEITNTTDGLSVFYNSEGQDIWGNKFLDSDIDLSIRSRVGVHYFKGNEFYNGTAKAIDLNDQDIIFSRFYVNENIPYHMPTNPDPATDWFINNPNVWTYFDDCDDESGRGKFYTDVVELSSFFEHIKSLQNSMPEVFFVKLFHLLKYENARDSFELPTYIKQDSVFAESCGLLELVDVTTQLSSLSKLSEGSSLTEEDILEIQSLQEQYILATDEFVKQSIISELRLLMASLKPGFDAEFLADSLAYDNLKYELETINCTDVLVQKWKDIYIKYIDFVQAGEVASEHQSSLMAYSQDCSDMYGDAIHLARALANTFDSTYYDIYDGCLTEPIEPRSNSTNTLNALVQPNPTKGTIVISTEKPVTGIVNVFDLSGKIVFSENIKKVNQHTLELNLEDGVYLINIISDMGEKYSKKIVVTK